MWLDSWKILMDQIQPYSYSCLYAKISKLTSKTENKATLIFFTMMQACKQETNEEVCL